MKKFVIVVAGGSGSRMKSNVPKQFLPLRGKPVLMHTIQTFRKYDEEIETILVLPEIEIDFWNDLCTKHGFKNADRIVAGGENRFQSVKNGLKAVSNKSLVGVHDGVRPFVSTKTISQCFKKAEMHGAAVPYIDMLESLRYSDQVTNYAIARGNIKIIQTPQVFQSEILVKAYDQEYQEEAFTDDASVVERFGGTIKMVRGNRENIKITTPFDMLIGEALVQS